MFRLPLVITTITTTLNDDYIKQIEKERWKVGKKYKIYIYYHLCKDSFFSYLSTKFSKLFVFKSSSFKVVVVVERR